MMMLYFYYYRSHDGTTRTVTRRTGLSNLNLLPVTATGSVPVLRGRTVKTSS